jgi:hypothetical protein
MISSGLPAATATAARVLIGLLPYSFEGTFWQIWSNFKPTRDTGSCCHVTKNLILVLSMKFLSILLLLTSCGQTITSGGTEPDTCGKDSYASLIGVQLAATTFPADLNARIIPPDTAVTLDFLAERLNIFTDADGIITRISCG